MFLPGKLWGKTWNARAFVGTWRMFIQNPKCRWTTSIWEKYLLISHAQDNVYSITLLYFRLRMLRPKHALTQWDEKVHNFKTIFTLSLRCPDSLRLLLFKAEKMLECRTATALEGTKCSHLRSVSSSCQMITVWIQPAMMESSSWSAATEWAGIRPGSTILK